MTLSVDEFKRSLKEVFSHLKFLLCSFYVFENKNFDCNRTGSNNQQPLALNDWAVVWVLICEVHLLCVFTISHTRLEWIYTLYLPEYQGTSCSKQARYLKCKCLLRDLNEPRTIVRKKTFSKHRNRLFVYKNIYFLKNQVKWTKRMSSSHNNLSGILVLMQFLLILI